MQRWFAFFAGLLAVSLAACGGGGPSGGGPIPNPGQSSPPTTYASYLRFVGPLAGAQVQADLRQAQEVAPMTGSTPIPIMVVSPLTSGMDTSAWGGTVQVVVSPMPLSSPSTSFALTDSDAVLQTPSPAPTGATPQPLPSGVIAQADVQSGSSPESQTAGVATATIGSPVNEVATTAVYSYLSIDLECKWSNTPVTGTNEYAGAHFGWSWNGSQWVGDDDVNTADIYLDGPGCRTAGSTNTAEPNATIHIPGGDVRFSTDTGFSSLTASQWTNTETSFDMQVVDQVNPDNSQNTEVLGRTKDGLHTFKLFPNSFGPQAQYFGAIEVSGASVDGF